MREVKSDRRQRSGNACHVANFGPARGDRICPLFSLTFVRRRRLHANLNANLKLDFYRREGADADADVSI